MMKILLGMVLYFCLVLLILPLLYKFYKHKYYYYICGLFGVFPYVGIKVLAPEINLSHYVIFLLPVIILAFYFYEWLLDKMNGSACFFCGETKLELVDYLYVDEDKKVKICSKCLKVKDCFMNN